MWFIIIFGSIPVLRPFFIRFGQTIKTSTNQSSDLNRRSEQQNTGRSKNDTWIPLGDRANAWTTCDPMASKAKNSVDAGSEEDILTGRSRSGHIMVTRDVQVTSKDVV